MEEVESVNDEPKLVSLIHLPSVLSMLHFIPWFVVIKRWILHALFELDVFLFLVVFESFRRFPRGWNCSRVEYLLFLLDTSLVFDLSLLSTVLYCFWCFIVSLLK